MFQMHSSYNDKMFEQSVKYRIMKEEEKEK